MKIDLQKLGELIAPLAQLIGNGEPDRIKQAVTQLSFAVAEVAQDDENPPTWDQIADHADAVIAKADQIKSEINS